MSVWLSGFCGDCSVSAEDIWAWRFATFRYNWMFAGICNPSLFRHDSNCVNYQLAMQSCCGKIESASVSAATSKTTHVPAWLDDNWNKMYSLLSLAGVAHWYLLIFLLRNQVYLHIFAVGTGFRKYICWFQITRNRWVKTQHPLCGKLPSYFLALQWTDFPSTRLQLHLPHRRPRPHPAQSDIHPG